MIFATNTTSLYLDFLKLTSQEINYGLFKTKNIYDKNDYIVLKLSNNDITFWTSMPTNEQNISIGDNLYLYYFTNKIDFFSYIKGFYTKSFDIVKQQKEIETFDKIKNHITNQHENPLISQLYSAIFLSTAISKELRDICVDFGVSHLVAISGFHLGVLTFILYWSVFILYNYFHKRYFPYRNIKFDIVVFSFFVLFLYLYLLGIVPSLLRAYVMGVFALILHRSNIKIISFYSLFTIVVIILSFMPSLIFSLSLWLSIFGVFYIFLFIKYFSKQNKIFLFFFFNIWIYLSLSPIIFYIFEVASIHQLYSPIVSILFSVFYPLSLFLHIIGFGGLFDDMLLWWFEIKSTIFDITISPYFIGLYLLVSLLSITNKKSFWLLNILMIGNFIYFLNSNI